MHTWRCTLLFWKHFCRVRTREFWPNASLVSSHDQRYISCTLTNHPLTALIISTVSLFCENIQRGEQWEDCSQCSIVFLFSKILHIRNPCDLDLVLTFNSVLLAFSLCKSARRNVILLIGQTFSRQSMLVRWSCRWWPDQTDKHL